MAITVITEPFDGSFINLNPVYNRMPYQVSSNRNLRDDFKYTTDVYYNGNLSGVSGTYIGTIRSSPEPNFGRGVFDVHKYLESVISPDLNWNATGVVNQPNSMKRYYVTFGEEFSPKLRFTNITARGGVSPYSGFSKMTFAQPHNLRALDAVYVETDNKQATTPIANGTYIFVQEVLNTTEVVLGGTFVAGAATTGTITEGEGYGMFFEYNGFLGFTMYNPTFFQVGDQFTHKKGQPLVNPQYDGIWSVTLVSGDSQSIVTNIPYSGSSLFGRCIRRNNAVVKNLASGSSYSWVNNHVDQYDDVNQNGLAMDFRRYIITGNGATSKFLTKTPYVNPYQRTPLECQKIQRDHYHTTNFITNNDLYVFDYTTQIRGFIYSDTLAPREFRLPLGSLYNPFNPQRTKFAVGIGPKNLDAAVTAGLITGGTINWSASNSISYFAFNSGSTSTISEERWLVLDNADCKYETYRLMWLNELGGLDYFNFKKRSDIDTKITRDTYTKRGVSGNYQGQSVGDRGETVFNVDAIQTYTLNSDWITEEESEWLEYLFLSPEVYILMNNKAYPVIVENDGIRRGIKANQSLFNQNITVRTSYKVNTQRN
jgi:hypothetical protein